MDTYQLSLIVISPICAFIGFLGKYILDKRSDYLNNIKKTQLENVEMKLKQFYYPVHSNLLRENIIWNRILSFYRSRNDLDAELVSKFFWELDKEMLDIHLDTQKIIQENIVKIHPDENLSNSLMKYDEHVTIYNIIRKVETARPTNMDEVNWPGTFESPYPSELLGLIDKQLKILKDKQTELIYSVV
jgi:hypothetical protein